MSEIDIRTEITPQIKANELLMQAYADGRAFLIVEGKSDFRLFNELLPYGTWEVEYLSGKHNVISCLNAMLSSGLNRVVALLDRDPYDTVVAERNVIFTENADLDADMFAIDGLIDRIIKRNSNIRDEPVLRRFQSDSWRQVILSLVLPWAAMREYSVKNSKTLSFADFPIASFADASSCRISLDRMAQLLSNRNQIQVSEDDVERAIAEVGKADIFSRVNGHHISRAIAWVVATILKSENLRSTAIEDLARMGLRDEELRKLRILVELDEWAHSIDSCVEVVHD